MHLLRHPCPQHRGGALINPDTLIVGIGNRYRGDDAVGCVIAERLRERPPANTEIVEHDGEPASLIERICNRPRVILIDAVTSGAEAGAIHRIDLGLEPLPGRFRCFSTHAFGVAEAVELARVMDQLPQRLLFYGIEAVQFGMNIEVTGPVQKAAERLIVRLRRQWADLMDYQ